VVFDWRKAESQEDKRELMKQLHSLLFAQKQQQVTDKKRRKLNARWIEVGGNVKVGDLALMLQNNQVGNIKEVRGKKAIVQLGLIQITVETADLVVVKEREEGVA
jgi:DNA mismatch repair protein MutS2